MSNQPGAERLRSNRHAADLLHHVRQQIVELEAQEQELRNYLLSHPDDLRGDDYEAVIGSQLRHRVDLEGLAAAIGESLMDKFTRSARIVAVRLRSRSPSPPKGNPRHD